MRMHILRHEGIFFYEPNIEEVERVYWCRPVCPSIRPLYLHMVKNC